MSRTKLLAAVLLVTGGLAAGAWARLVPQAGAQDAAPQKPAAPREYPAGDISLGDMAASVVASEKDPATPPAWEFKYYAPAGAVSPATIERAAARYAEGDWAFAGTATFPNPSSADLKRIEFADARKRSATGAVEVLVFRRRPQEAGGQAVRGRVVGELDRLLLLQSARERLDNLARGLQQEKSMPRPQAAESDEVQVIRAEIAELQKRLDAAKGKGKGKGKKTLTLPAEEVGSNPTALMDTLDKLAALRYGEGARARLELGSSANGLYLSGDAEAVDWAAGAARTLKGLAGDSIKPASPAK